MPDIASRLQNRVQITCDADRPYLTAIEDDFGTEVDFAQLQKIYGAPQENEKRDSPAVCIGCDMKVVTGDPDPKHVSTKLRGTPELDGANHDAPLYSPVQWILAEAT